MTQPLSIPPRAWAGIFTVSLLWGGSFLSIRLALDEIPTFTVVAFRVLGAAVVLWLYVLATRQRLPRGSRVWIGLIVMGLFNNAVPFSLITWGEHHIPTGLTSILNASTAIFGTLVAAIFLKDERLSPRKIIGIALGFAGVATAMGLQNLARLDLTSLAQLALMGSSLSYAVSNTWARVMLRDVPPVVAAAGMLTCSSAVMVPVALVVDGVPDFAYSSGALMAVGYLSVFATAIAYILVYNIIALAGAANTSVATLLVAPVAILLGAIVLGESLRPAAYAGFALLAAGLVVLDGRLVSWLRGRRVSVS